MRAQRERFEAAWLESEKPQGEHAILLLGRSMQTGKYFSIEMEAAWKSWKLCESSGMERAAVICSKESDVQLQLYKELGTAYREGAADVSDQLARKIRALMAQEE